MTYQLQQDCLYPTKRWRRQRWTLHRRWALELL